MDVSTERLALAIGARIKQERITRQWTLDQLADTAGVSRRMVVNVEQGAANPSVGTLLRLSAALGVSLPALVDVPEYATVKVTRKGEGAVLWTGEQGGKGVLVAGTRSPDVVELWDWTLNAGESHASEAHGPGTRELLQVLCGRLEVEAAGELHILETGDSVAFPGDAAHRYANPDAEPVRFCLTVFEPGIGTDRHSEAKNV